MHVYSRYCSNRESLACQALRLVPRDPESGEDLYLLTTALYDILFAATALLLLNIVPRIWGGIVPIWIRFTLKTTEITSQLDTSTRDENCEPTEDDVEMTVKAELTERVPRFFEDDSD